MEKSRYLQIKEQLDRVSPSFCAAKWLQVTLHLHSGTNHSCHHPKVHSIPIGELNGNPSALHNTAFKKKQRNMMKSGTRPAECGYCWTIEDLNSEQISDRFIKSSDPWAEPHLDQVAALPADADVQPSYVEVSFSRTCNFKCSYCSPNFSTRWAQEIKQHGPYEVSPIFQTLDDQYEEDQNPYIRAFWEWWPELKKRLQVFRITGGEPLLSPNTFRLLEDLKNDPSPNLELAVNSNLGVPEASINRLIEVVSDLIENKKIAGFQIYTSIDAWGRRAEYIRHGMEFDRYWSNVETLLRRLPGAKIVFMSTYNALSVTSFSELLAQTLELRKKYIGSESTSRLTLDIPYLRNPLYQAANVLPSDFHEAALKSLSLMEENRIEWDHPWGFMDHEIAKMRRICQWMKKPLPEAQLSRFRKEFFAFFSEHDRRRGTDFVKTFPEYQDFYSDCERLYLSGSIGARGWINRLRSLKTTLLKA